MYLVRLLLMAVTIASNLTVFSDATGHGNQSHLVWAQNQQRWWLFVIKTKTATVVSAYVSSSNDLTTATWSSSTDSPAFPSSRALTSNDQRNLGCVGFANGSTDVAHVSVGIGVGSGAVNGFTEHIRCTFTGGSSITWESWSETNNTAIAPAGWDAVKGNALQVSTPSNFLHEGSLVLDGAQEVNARKSSNGDTTSTWTTGFGADAVIDSSLTNTCNAYALASLASDVMLCVYEDGGAANPNSTGLRYTKSGVTGTWSAGTGTGVTGNGTTSQDFNDWVLCDVDNTHIYAFRRSGSNTFDWRKFDGNTTWSTPTNGVPNQNHLAGSGLFAVSDGSGSIYLFLLDSVSNQPVKYCIATGVSGVPTWGSWIQMEGAGSSARNYISGCPTVGNSQIGVIFTQVNGSNFDIVVSGLKIVTITNAVTTLNSTDNAALTTGAFIPVASDLLVAFAVVSGQVSGGTFTDSQGLGWTTIQTAVYNSSNSVVMAVANAFAANSSMTVTFTPTGGPSSTGVAIDVLRVGGMQRVGADAVRQSVKDENQASGNPTFTVSMQTVITNPVVAAIGNLSNAAGMLVLTSTYTAGTDAGYATPSTGISSAFRAAGLTATVLSPWGANTSASAWGGIGAELNAAPPVPIDWQLGPTGAPASPVWNLIV